MTRLAAIPATHTTQPVAAATDLYLRNMAALWRADGRLAHAIDQLPLDSALAVEPARSGAPTASLETAPGRRIYLHSRYDPVGEAAQLCRPLAEESAPIWSFILCGLGIGHAIAPLREQVSSDGLIIVLEPDLTTIKTALSIADVSEALQEDRLVFVTSADPADLHAKLDRHASLLMLGTRFVVLPAYVRLHEEFFRVVRGLITDYAAFARMSLVTLVANARITCRNIANNLPAYLASPSIDGLRARFRGYPAVVVAAGPSLGRNVDQLKEARDRAVVIAVQTTLKPLLARGIQPDFVTSLDFSDLSKRFFEGVDPGGTELVAEPKASWEVIDAFCGGAPGASQRPARRLCMLANDFAIKCVGPQLGRRGGLRAGSTVAHLAFYLAEHLGCDPIIIIGQDLGFTGGVYYTPGVAMHDMWRPELGRFCSLEMKEWERIARARSILQRVTDLNGRALYTDDQMFTYLQQFERDFAACAARVIDATEGGVRKRGTEPMTLRDALERFAVRPIPERARRPDESSQETPAAAGERLHAAAAEIERRLVELAEFQVICDDTRGLLDEMKGLLDRPEEFDHRVLRVDELRAIVEQKSQIFAMVSDVSQLGEIQKLSADRRLALDRARTAGGIAPKERARRQLARDARFIEHLLDGCAYLKRILTESRERLLAAANDGAPR